MLKGELVNLKREILRCLNYVNFLKCKRAVSRSLKESTNIYIFSDSRGGSTFFTELFLDGNKGVLWEPLMPKALKKYNTKLYQELGNIPYIEPDAEWEEAKFFFKDLFNGVALMPAMLKYDLPDINYHNPERCIVKFCRANALLPWIVNNFTIKPIHLVRHPLAVISSQLRYATFQGYKVHSDVLSYQNGKYKKLFYDHKNKITNISSVEEMFTVWWCLKNYGPIFSENKKWLTVSYEYLLNNPEEEKKRIESYLHASFSGDFFDKIKRPSLTTSAGSNILEGKSQLETWKRHLDPKQKEIILDTLHKFGFYMFTEEVEPDYALLGYS